MLWFLLVFLSDALVTLFSAKVQIALSKLSWEALIWDVFLSLTISINIIGFTQAGWWMTIPSVLGSSLGMFGAIWHGRRKSRSLRQGTRVLVEGFRPDGAR